MLPIFLALNCGNLIAGEVVGSVTSLALQIGQPTGTFWWVRNEVSNTTEWVWDVMVELLVLLTLAFSFTRWC
jgi:hypothetical protein